MRIYSSTIFPNTFDVIRLQMYLSYVWEWILVFRWPESRLSILCHTYKLPVHLQWENGSFYVSFVVNYSIMVCELFAKKTCHLMWSSGRLVWTCFHSISFNYPEKILINQCWQCNRGPCSNCYCQSQLLLILSLWRVNCTLQYILWFQFITLIISDIIR